jgi:signal transduction histidine kinase
MPDVTLVVDRDRLSIALDELIENAVRHTSDGDLIEIAATENRGTIRITIRDGGSGIPAAALDNVFDRFYRVDGDRNRRGGGAGLGLSIVRAVIEAHGGTIRAESAAGTGTTITIELPSARAKAVTAAADGLDTDRGVQLAT